MERHVLKLTQDANCIPELLSLSYSVAQVVEKVRYTFLSKHFSWQYWQTIH
jgi:hypothetical protein